MNEIQAVKTAKIEEVKKNSKKGFTLVELVVVIAILAILAAIAIPVVSSTIQSSQRSTALSNAQTLELALKEAHAQIVAGDKTVYNKVNATTGALGSSGDDATLSNVKVKTVRDAKAIKMADKVTIGGKEYKLMWSKTDSKCYYVTTSGTGTSATTANLDTSVALPSDATTEIKDAVTLNKLFNGID